MSFAQRHEQGIVPNPGAIDGEKLLVGSAQVVAGLPVESLESLPQERLSGLSSQGEIRPFDIRCTRDSSEVVLVE
jgi:hypothetical protein